MNKNKYTPKETKLRRFFVVIAILFAVTFLVFGALSYVIRETIFNERYITQTLHKAGIYKTLIPNILTLASVEQQESANMAQSNISIEKITPIITKAIPPKAIQDIIEPAIHGVYAWASGSSDSIIFTVNTTAMQKAVRDGFNEYLATTVNTLPVCQKAVHSFDPISAICRPNKIYSASDIAQLTQSFLNELPLFEKSDFTSKDIGITSDAYTTPPLQYVPTIYKWVTLAPYIWLGLAVFCMGLVAIVSKDVVLRWKRLGNIWMFAAAELWLFSGILFVITQQYATTLLANNSSQQAFVQNVIVPLYQAGTEYILFLLVYIAVAYTIFAAVLYVAGHYVRIQSVSTNDG